MSKDQLTDKEQLQLEEEQEAQQHQKGLLAKSLQEEGEEELYKIKQISAQGPLQLMADDDSDMADIMRERFPEDEKDGSKYCLQSSIEMSLSSADWLYFSWKVGTWFKCKFPFVARN